MKQQITTINNGRKLDGHAKIWRYLDFSRLVFLLETRTIHFSHVSAFEDKYDGVFNCLNDDDHYDITDAGKIIRTGVPSETRAIENSARYKQAVTLYYQERQSATGVSCWRLADHESHAMWRVFLKSDHGVAIESTPDSLADSIVPDKYRLLRGIVRYIDYAKEKIPLNNVMNAFFYKNVYFEHEKELRLLCFQKADGVMPGPIPVPNFKPLPDGGVDLAVDLSKLITGIHVSPYSPSWFRGLVGDVIKRYGVDVPVHASAIELRRV